MSRQLPDGHRIPDDVRAFINLSAAEVADLAAHPFALDQLAQGARDHHWLNFAEIVKDAAARGDGLDIAAILEAAEQQQIAARN